MKILGLNAHHASACIVIDGKLVAAAEEERFRRVKHWAGFPSAAIEYCLREAGVALNDLDHIAVKPTFEETAVLSIDRIRHADFGVSTCNRTGAGGGLMQ